MIDRLINRNLDFLKRTLQCDDDSIEIYRYALRIIYSYVIDVLTLLVLAIITHTVGETIIILATFALMQVYGGGFHAETQLRCFMLTLLGWFIGVFGIKYLVSLHPLVGVIAMIVFSIIVLIYTPVLNDKHPVSGDVYKRSKKIVRVTLVVFDLLMIISILADIELIYNALSIMQILSTVSIVAAVIKRRIKQRKNRFADEVLLDIQES